MTIQELKNKLSIMEVLNHYNIKIDKNNRTCCPFHDDKNPSMQIYPKTNTYCCFSSNCSAGTGDQIEFIQKMEKCNKHAALKIAGQLIGSSVQATNKLANEKEKTMEEIFIELREQLRQHQEALNYLQSRNLNPEKLEVGYNPIAKPIIKDLKNCIIFPLRDKENKIVSFYGRSISNASTSSAYTRHFYLKDRKGIYPSYPKSETEKLIITEAIIDAASLIMNDEWLMINEGKPSIIACFGTNGLNDEIRNAIQDLPNLNEIIFAFDNDEAGNKAVEKYTEQLKIDNGQWIISKIILPENEDVNSTAMAHDKDIFLHLLNDRRILHPQATQEESESFQLLQSNEFPKSPRTLNFKLETLNCVNPDQLQYNTTELLITLLGGISMNNLDRMRVTLYMRRNPHINTAYSIRQNIDLYQDDLVEKFIRRSAEKLEISTSLISKAIAELTEELENYRLKQIESKKVKTNKHKTLSEREKEQALKNLKQENLMQWTLEKLNQTGIIGEKENAMILFISMCSRLQEDPVSVICLSASGSGKSYLLEKVAQCFPSEDIIENTQMTDNSFYYWKDGVKNKIILIEDMEGAQNVEYPIRELISKKSITKTVVHKDSKGNLQTIQHKVEGPATFCGCTTKEKLYEDNANRCLLIYLDNSKTQDENIMQYHKKLRAGLIDKINEQQEREELQNMQRLLKPVSVINPYATIIELPESVLKPRRSIGILFSFIEAITLYHQHQCEYIMQNGKVCITHPSHIEWGFKLLKESLFRKSDELSAALRNFLEQVQSYLQKHKKKSFYMQEIRLALALHPRTAQRYLYELTQYGYISITGGNKYRKGYEYEFTSLSENNNLKSSIDHHIEKMMQRIWNTYHEQNKKSTTVRQQYDNKSLSHSKPVESSLIA